MKNLRVTLGAQACGDVKNRDRVKVVGQVTSTRIVPRSNGRWFEVVIEDETGIVDGWFFGRKSIPGMNFGSIVLFEGLAQLDEGEMTIANPYYEFL